MAAESCSKMSLMTREIVYIQYSCATQCWSCHFGCEAAFHQDLFSSESSPDRESPSSTVRGCELCGLSCRDLKGVDARRKVLRILLLRFVWAVGPNGRLVPGLSRLMYTRSVSSAPTWYGPATCRVAVRQLALELLH